MKIRITIKNTHTVVTDIGSIPPNLIRELLVKNDGTFDGNWSPGDLPGQETWTTDSVEVEEVKGK
jgi:hypothetical protein